MITRNIHFLYYVAALATFFLLKFSYTLAGTDDLGFLLFPTDKIIRSVTGYDSTYIAGSGYFYEMFNIILGRTCSGFNFWILCFTMLSFLALRYFEGTKKALVLPMALFAAYVLTIFANACRIILSIFGQGIGDIIITPRPHHLLHEGIGFFIYLFFLISVYLVTDIFLKKLTTPNAKLTKPQVAITY